MKKILVLCLVTVLMLSMTNALADPKDLNGQILPDFSVTTINGSTFSLSESLKSHDLVLINFWATWCGPCCMEFPFLETAWEQYSDRVDVIALSVEQNDTANVLKSFANDYNLKFSIGRDESGLFNNMNGSAIPTTLIVDKDRRVVSVEVGAKGSVAEFATLFDGLLKSSRIDTSAGTESSVDMANNNLDKAEHSLTYIDGTKGVYSTEGPQFLVDGSINTKWCVQFNASNKPYVIFRADNPVAAKGLLLVKANDDDTVHGRSPRTWELYASNSSSAPKRNDKTWVLIDSHQNGSDQTMNENTCYNSYAFMFRKEVAAYKYYMFVVTNTFGDKYLQLSELRLITDNTITAPFVVNENKGDAVIIEGQLSYPKDIMQVIPKAYISSEGHYLFGRVLTPLLKGDLLDITVELKDGQIWPAREVIEMQVGSAYNVDENTVESPVVSHLVIVSD